MHFARNSSAGRMRFRVVGERYKPVPKEIKAYLLRQHPSQARCASPGLMICLRRASRENEKFRAVKG